MLPLCCSRQLRDRSGREDHKETDGRNLVTENGSPSGRDMELHGRRNGHHVGDTGMKIRGQKKEAVPNGTVKRQRELLQFKFSQFSPVHVYQTQIM